MPDERTNSGEVFHAHHRIGGVAVTELTPSNRVPADPTLIFVHGGCHGRWCWAAWQTQLANAGYRSLALDWFGHGTSAPPPAGRSLTRSLTEIGGAGGEIDLVVDHVLAQTGIPPILTGHSMGGLASMLAAARRPGTLTGLALLAPAPPAECAAAPLDLPLNESYPWHPGDFRNARRLFFSDASLADSEQYYALLTEESPRAVYEATRFTVQVHPEAITCPVMLLAAARDPLVPGAALRELAFRLRLPLTTVPGGHGIPLSARSGVLVSLLARWIRSIEQVRKANTSGEPLCLGT